MRRRFLLFIVLFLWENASLSKVRGKTLDFQMTKPRIHAIIKEIVGLFHVHYRQVYTFNESRGTHSRESGAGIPGKCTGLILGPTVLWSLFQKSILFL